MINVKLDQADIERVKSVLNGVRATLGKEISAAINKTAKKVQTFAAREVGQEMNVPIKILKKTIKQKTKANKDHLGARLGFWEGYPIPLKYFGARALKKGGVTYKYSKRRPRTGIIRDAFIVKQYGNNVYRRKGQGRGPLEKQVGPAPGYAYSKLGVVEKSASFAKTELPKQIQARIRYLTLKAQGQLRGKQSGRY